MNLDNFKNKTAKILLDIKAINFQPKNPFRLTSGKLSPVYVDCRKIISHLKERRAIINMGSKLIKKKINLKSIDCIAGGETAGILGYRKNLISQWFISEKNLRVLVNYLR